MTTGRINQVTSSFLRTFEEVLGTFSNPRGVSRPIQDRGGRPRRRWVPLLHNASNRDSTGLSLDGSALTTSPTASTPRGEFVDIEIFKGRRTYAQKTKQFL
ncbi:hypothetical protein CEXT_675291 [Caerostris extrusa]|uniref:Uncharacterized protein n=1 Tax=Caerostris extrusa TaxID=172846 RepID=A0AAV4M8S2_CAEEX|nr:hypothetical protein CEXT_802771 [Caerostris extrusa]GIY54510.1 hypothetical protein CEXT_675291 [Caerostris extrusa]